jgi:transposase
MELYIGVDFHPHQQTACWCDTQTGEIKTRTFFHHTDELTKFYQQMPPSIVGIEATSKATWFEKLLFENKHKLIVGNPNVIRKRAISRHKNDNRDARHIFDLLIRGDFPMLWRKSQASIDILEIVRLRHNLVKQRTQTANRLQALAHQSGLRKGKIKSILFQTMLKNIEIDENFSFQRELLFEMWENFNQKISKLELWLQEKANQCSQVKLLQTQSGVGYLTALCLINTVGDVSRFDKPTKQVVAFIGLDPLDESSGSKVKFGRISKAGSPILRFLLGQAAQTASRFDQKLKAKYRQLTKKKHKAVAKTAIARKLLVKLVIMLRDKITAQEFDERGRTVGNARGTRGLKQSEKPEITVA